jgi:hypothetical protein
VIMFAAKVTSSPTATLRSSYVAAPSMTARAGSIVPWMGDEAWVPPAQSTCQCSNCVAASSGVHGRGV